jgi:hypothetical protein
VRRIVAFLALGVALVVHLSVEAQWLRGNTHAHTLESDGDSTPAEVARWYRDHGYDFLVLTDHDKVTKLEEPGIVLIPGEEVTDKLPKKPLHVCAIGITRAVTPQHGATVVENLQRNIDAVREAGGIAAINHPNFGWAFGADELLQLNGATLLEIASGHPYVNMEGPPSVESMWDRLLTAGKRIYGIGVDDSHHLKRPWDTNDMAPPGKAWVMVRAEKNAASIVAALARGDFYASTGVELAEYEAGEKAVRVRVREKNFAHYRIAFIGKGGKVLQETVRADATYAIRGNELYVRARVTDSNGKRAWTQAWFISRSRSR